MFYYLKQSLKVINVKRILNLSQEYVEIQLPKTILKINGKEMYISYIEGKEIIIKGKIDKIIIEDFNLWRNFMIDIKFHSLVNYIF